jgi:hypothetical protein
MVRVAVNGGVRWAAIGVVAMVLAACPAWGETFGLGMGPLRTPSAPVPDEPTDGAAPARAGEFLLAQGPGAPGAGDRSTAEASRPLPLRKGSFELGVKGAYSFSAQDIGDAPVGKVVRMYWLIPKAGYTFAEFPDGSPFRGSFQIFLEPSVAYITHPARTYLLGVSAIFRYNFLLWNRVVPYIDGGAGLLNTNLRIHALGEVIEFMPQAGLGVLFRVGERVSVDVGWRYHHISNAGQTEPARNVGINSLFFHGGVSWHY